MEEVNKNVSHPSHYNQGIEAIDIIESWDLGYWNMKVVINNF